MDDKQALATRSVAFQALAGADVDCLASLVGHLNPETIAEITQCLIVAFYEAASDDYPAAQQIMRLLEEFDGSESSDAIAGFNTLRVKSGTPVAIIYADALRCGKLAAGHGALLDILVKEGSRAAETLVAELYDAARNPAQRSHLQKYLMQMRTASAAGKAKHAKPLQGEVYVASCDGQGAFMTLPRFGGHLA